MFGKKIGSALVGASLVALPLAASAQSSSAVVCPQIVRALSHGSRGSDVAALQTYLGVVSTGYYGSLTARAVAQFQAGEGIAQVGVVGPLTRAALARRCGNPYPASQTFSASPTYGAVPLTVMFTTNGSINSNGYVVEFGDGSYAQMDKGSCVGVTAIAGGQSGIRCSFSTSHVYAQSGTYTATLSPYIACLYSNPRCMIATQLLGSVTITVTNGSTTGAPSIFGIDGPTQLAVGQSGTWSVHVTDSSGYLSYSVRWGDEALAPIPYGVSASAPIASFGTFTHTYATAGTYSPTFTVTNANGQSVTASATVVVQ